MKKWYKSRTVWSAILKALAGVLTSLVLVLNGDMTFGDFLPGAVSLVWSAVDVVLRFDTNEVIE